MNKKLVFLPLILGFGLASCGNVEVGYTDEDIALSSTVYNLDLNDKLTLNVQNSNLNKKIIWSSDNESVAKISNSGVVTAISTGEATITASYKTLSTTCNIKVTDSYSVAYIETSTSEISLGIDGYVEVSAQAMFKGSEISGLTYTWSCEDDTVLITPYNNVAGITALKGGKTNLFVSTTYNGKEIFSSISVNVIDGVVYYDVSGANLVDGEYEVSLKRNTTKELSIAVYVDGFLVKDPFITFAVEDSSIVEMEGNTIKALKIGKTTISANYKNLGAVIINVTVTIL